MDKILTIAKAINIARHHVYPIRFGRQWVVTAPWREIGGPTTHSQPRDLNSARAYCAEKRIELALELLGHHHASNIQWQANKAVLGGDNWTAVVRKYGKGV